MNYTVNKLLKFIANLYWKSIFLGGRKTNYQIKFTLNLTWLISGKCLFGEMLFGELSVAEMSVRRIARSGNCPSGNCRRGKVRRGTVWIPILALCFTKTTVRYAVT